MAAPKKQPAKKSSIQKMAEAKKANPTEPVVVEPKTDEKKRKPTKEELGRTVQKSFFTTPQMARELLLAKADHGMTYDAIINEALELWMKSKGAPSND